jgi:hypothetical protein
LHPSFLITALLLPPLHDPAMAWAIPVK